MKQYSLILLIVLSLSLASAAVNEGYCVNAEVVDISPTSVEIGEEFTVGIHLENCGLKLPSDVTYNIVSLPAEIEVNEQLSTTISQLGCPSSERFLLYHMKATNDAKPGTHLIKTQLIIGDESISQKKDYEISITVLGDEAKLSVASVKTEPVLPYEGDTVELTLRIENYESGNANSVRVRADHPFQGIKASFIGTLEADEDGPAIFTFIADSQGEFEVPVEITYKDDFGEHKVESSVSLMVLEKQIDWFRIIFLAILGVIILIVIIYYFKTKKDKNKLIEQLLKGNHNNHTEPRGIKKAKK